MRVSNSGVGTGRSDEKSFSFPVETTYCSSCIEFISTDKIITIACIIREPELGIQLRTLHIDKQRPERAAGECAWSKTRESCGLLHSITKTRKNDLRMGVMFETKRMSVKVSVQANDASSPR